VRSLELLWALVFAVVPNGEKVVTDLLTDLEFDLDPGGKLIMVGKLVGDSETLRQSWMKSRVQVELERRLSKLEARVDASPRVVNSSGSGLESSTPCLDVSRLGVAHFEPIRQSSPDRTFLGHESSVLTGRGPLPNTRYARHNTTPNRGQPSPNDIQPLSFPPYSQRLLEKYFSYTNSWLPIIERHKIFQVLYTSPGSHAANRGDESTLWAILAYSSLQEARGRADAVSTEGPTDDLDVEGVCLTPRQLYTQARRSIPDEEEIPEPGHGKALLILSLYQLYQGALSAAWRLIGRSVRISLGLQGRPRAPTSDTDENQICTLLGCFVLDTIVSSHLGKPPHLRSADIQHLPALAETGPNEWEPWTPPRSGRPNLAPGPPEPMRAVSMFNRFVEIIRILNAVRWELVVGSPAHVAERHLASLRHWSDHLPQHCTLPSLPDLGQQAFPSRFSPQLVNLHLAFKSTLVLMRTQHNSPTTHWIPFDQIFPGPKRPFILRLLSIYGEKFGDPFTPAIFASYKSFSDTENNLAPSSLNAEVETSNPHQVRHLRFAVPIPETGADYSTEDVMSTATPSDSIAVSHSEQTFPFGFSEGALGPLRPDVKTLIRFYRLLHGTGRHE